MILQQLEAEKSVDRETLIEAIRSAIESAARKRYRESANIVVDVEADTLTFKVFEIRTVTDSLTDEEGEISLEEGQELNPDVAVGQRLKVPMEPKDFGRIAAQTAKQVIIQKIRDAERDNIYDEFKGRVGGLVTGIVKRLSHGNIIISINKAEAIVPQREQSARENFKPGDRLRAYVIEVEKGPRGAQIVLSRTTTELVRGLFDLEVPEIYDGTVLIKAIAREPGSRTKVAVLSNDPNVDAVGACVGMKGSRVRAVVEELSGEKIDIVRWSEDPVELCRSALNPADILRIDLDEDSKSITVLVPHDQLSLAIGKRGQNARLASRLIGWNIDIRSEELPPSESEGDEGAESLKEVEESPESPEKIEEDETAVGEVKSEDGVVEDSKGVMEEGKTEGGVSEEDSQDVESASVDAVHDNGQ